jgi:hypothetical protein
LATIGNSTEELTPSQVRAIAALLTEKDVLSAAKAAGIGERTMHRHLQDPAFQKGLRAAEASALDAAVPRLSGAATTAVSVILALMLTRDISASVRLRAATTILEQLVKLRELNELEERVSRLEEQLGQGERGQAAYPVGFYNGNGRG